ncbi:MAG: hypothetical protein QGI24_03005 [Kiritimatiellia bacterium]|jgi:hypothetical protein|nr:hypothetical protein [Kiritimatiellia bacterium]MDP6847732.1 hypothetical protein [Kiritimatiellia bacterium]
MAGVNEWIAREYFETLGYLVCQPRKYTVPGRHKKASEEIDLVVHNAAIGEQQIPGHIVWSSADLKNVSRAIVGVRGWHTERFYASTFEQTPEILRFVEPDSIAFASKILGSDSMAKILCLPRLPASGELEDKIIDVLKEKGIDGVITFRTMLSELIAGVETHRNYEKSDLLQVIRLLKNYDFLKDSQLELFERKKRKS